MKPTAAYKLMSVHVSFAPTAGNCTICIMGYEAIVREIDALISPDQRKCANIQSPEVR